MNSDVFTIKDIENLVQPIAEKYKVEAIQLRKILKKNVDVFEINEINQDSDFYNVVMRERLLVA